MCFSSECIAILSQNILFIDFLFLTSSQSKEIGGNFLLILMLLKGKNRVKNENYNNVVFAKEPLHYNIVHF